MEILGPQPPKSKGLAFGSVNFHRNIRKLNYRMIPWGQEWDKWISEWQKWERTNRDVRQAND